MSQDTLYVRGKAAERGAYKQSFMRDGFNEWAESDAPARIGQQEKIPASTVNTTMSGSALMQYSDMPYFARRPSRPKLSKHSKMMHESDMSGEGVSSFLSSLGSKIKSGATQLGKIAYENRAQLGALAKEYSPLAIELAKAKLGLGAPRRRRATKQSKKSREDERLAMEVYHMKHGMGGYPSGYGEGMHGQGVSSFLSSLGSKIKSGATHLGKIAYENRAELGNLVKEYSPLAIELAKAKLGLGKPRASRSGRKPSARNMIVRQVMMERGVSLPQASRIVKQEGLY
jgi:hypothetical protein